MSALLKAQVLFEAKSWASRVNLLVSGHWGQGKTISIKVVCRPLS